MLPKILKILFPTALGSAAPHVFRYALSLAHEYGGELHVVHACEPLSPFGQSLVELHLTHEDAERMHAEAREKVRAQLEQKLKRLVVSEIGRVGADKTLIASLQVLEGQPADIILQRAEDVGADLIVMGKHRHSALGETLIGHTANRVSHRSTIPVMLVPIPAGYEE